MDSADINWIAVAAATLLMIVLGALWYSPVLLASRWMEAVGRRPEDLRMGPSGYGVSVIASFLAATALAYVVDWVDADELLEGLLIGASVWLGFVASTLAVNTYFGGRPRSLWVIDNGYQLLSYVLMGALLAVWD